MPAYLYQCVHCQAQETRIGGLDDHLALCASCRNMMLRLDLDLFAPYFTPRSEACRSNRNSDRILTPRRSY